MTELLWILTWLPLVLTAVSELPAPTKVYVTLDNSGYILRWEPGAGTPVGTSFKIQTKKERSAWESVPDCEQVQNPLSCNLTQAFRELTEMYDIEVLARLEDRTSQPAILKGYKPMAHLPLPLLNVTRCGSGLCVDLLPGSPFQHLREAYHGKKFMLQINSSKEQMPTELEIQSLGTENLTHLSPGTKYCFSIRFADSTFDLESNFSRPVCDSIPQTLSADAVVGVVLCVLILAGLAVVALLFLAGFICLKPKQVPQVLTSISHFEVVPVSPCRASLSSLLNVRVMAPPVGRNTASHLSSEETDEECCTETSGRSSLGANYTLRPGANLLSSSSSSSESSLPPKPATPPDGSALSPEAPAVPETQPETEQNLLESESLVRTEEEEEEEEAKNVAAMDGQNVNLLSLTFGWPEKHNEEEEEEEEEEEAEAKNVAAVDGQNVNLLSLTFGWPEKHNEEEEDCPEAPGEPPLLPPSPPATDVSSWTAEDEEWTDEDCAYMNRPPAEVSERLLRSDPV